MIKIIFRVLLFALGLFVVFQFGRSAIKPIWYRISGSVVEGKVIGFLAGRYSPSVQLEPTGVRNGKTKARRPVFRYPIAISSTDSLTGRSDVSTLFTFSQFKINESVTVVFASTDPQDSYLFNWQLILMDFLVVLFGLYMLFMGLTGKGG